MSKLSNKQKLSVMKALQTLLILHRFWVHVDVSGKRRVGEVIGYNRHTTWVRVMKGAKSYFTILRHNKKHNVSDAFRSEEIINEDVHTTT
jgi:hypothetical protein